jgi:hypothetical protein
MPVPEPMPNPKYDPVQAAPKARPARTKPAPPMPVIEEPAVPTVEEPAVPTVEEPAVPTVEAPAAPAFEAPAAPAVEEFVAPTAEAPLPEAEPAIPTPTTEPLLTVPAPATPSAAKLTPEPRRLAPPRPLSNSLPYDPTDPFADPPASDAPAPRATPTTQDRSPERLPTGPEIPRFGAEEFSPVGTGVIVQPTSGVASDRPAVRPAIRIVPVNDLPLYQAR